MGKKKERTPEQKKKRLRFAGILLAAMLVTVLIAPKKEGKKDLDSGIVAEAMDGRLPALLDSLFGESACTGTEMKESPILITVEAPARKAWEEAKEMQMRMTDEKVAENFRHYVDSLEEVASSATAREYYVRAIVVRLRDNTLLRGFQKMTPDLKESDIERFTQLSYGSAEKLQDLVKELK